MKFLWITRAARKYEIEWNKLTFRAPQMKQSTLRHKYWTHFDDAWHDVSYGNVYLLPFFYYNYSTYHSDY